MDLFHARQLIDNPVIGMRLSEIRLRFLYEFENGTPIQMNGSRFASVSNIVLVATDSTAPRD